MTAINIMSNYIEDALLNHLLRNTAHTPTGNVYLALYSVEPGESGGGTELSGGGYTRMQCPSFTIEGSSATNSAEIQFPIATSNWSAPMYMGIIDASSGGNLLFYGELTNPVTVNANDTFKISTGSLVIALRGTEDGGWGEATGGDMLNFVLNNGSSSTPGLSVYMALGRSVVYSTHYNLLTWSEISAIDYSRKQIGGTSKWAAPVNGYTESLTEIVFTEVATYNWGTVNACAFFNSSSEGDCLFWGTLDKARTILIGDGIKFQAGDINITLDTPPSSLAPPPVID